MSAWRLLMLDPRARWLLLAAGLVLAAGQGAVTAFLEVAHDNGPALALYGQSGFEPVGRRPAYYARAAGLAADALVLRKALAA